MKKWLIILLTIAALNAHSQIIDSLAWSMGSSEQFPKFPGKSDSLWCLLESNFRYDILNACNDTVKYIIRFSIDTLGTASDFEIIRSYPIPYKANFTANDSTVRSEILRVFRMMPNWEPGYQKGKKQRCWVSIGVIIPYSDYKCQNRNNY